MSSTRLSQLSPITARFGNIAAQSEHDVPLGLASVNDTLARNSVSWSRHSENSGGGGGGAAAGSGGGGGGDAVQLPHVSGQS